MSSGRWWMRSGGNQRELANINHRQHSESDIAVPVRLFCPALFSTSAPHASPTMALTGVAVNVYAETVADTVKL